MPNDDLDYLSRAAAALLKSDDSHLAWDCVADSMAPLLGEHFMMLIGRADNGTLRVERVRCQGVAGFTAQAEDALLGASLNLSSPGEGPATPSECGPFQVLVDASVQDVIRQVSALESLIRADSELLEGSSQQVLSGRGDVACWLLTPRGAGHENPALLGALMNQASLALAVPRTPPGSEDRSSVRVRENLEAQARLAGKVAHDFNNLLASIISFSQFVDEALEEGDDKKEDLSEVTSAANAASALTQQLLAFSRRGAAQVSALDAKECVADVAKQLSAALPDTIVIDVAPCAEAVTVLADEPQLNQLLVNLGINAGDAMPEGGTLTLSIRAGEKQPEGLPPGRYVQIDVTDTGSGIDPTIRDRLFEPFFTTRNLRSRPGLGLSTCYGVALRMGGSMSVASEVGSGSTFSVTIPAASETEG